MALLNDRDRESVRGLLAVMRDPVTLTFFTQTFGCETCDETRQILTEVAGLSDKISIDEVNYVLDADKVAAHGIQQVPAIVVSSGERRGVRFYGAPAGYEFMSLLDAIVLASGGPLQLSGPSLALVNAVNTPTELQVFVTPT
jgi:alkyl hydroperoxide reductase subunit AhpF